MFTDEELSKLRPALVPLIGKSGLVGCEVGVAGGGHAARMLHMLDMKKFFLIDPYDSNMIEHNIYTDPLFESEARRTCANNELFELCKNRILDVTGDTEVIFLKKLSWNVTEEEIPASSLDFCYIDGDHSPDAVMRDLETFWSKVKPGGILGGHDYQQPGPWYAQAKIGVDRFFTNKRKVNIGRGDAKIMDWWVIR